MATAGWPQGAQHALGGWVRLFSHKVQTRQLFPTVSVQLLERKSAAQSLGERG